MSPADHAAARAPGPPGRPFNRARHFDRILQTRSVKPVYQPIVHIGSRDVVAFEALARGPQGSPLERPDLLFATARDLNLVGELDWVCRAKAMDGAMRSGLGQSQTLFVNVEPDVAATRAPDDLLLTLKHAEQDLRVVLEVTERALMERPAELLHWLSWARNRWWGVALDDVGATSESLALMPFVHPDVIKLDAKYVRAEDLDEEEQRVIDAVHAQSSRTGATILAEGIENGRHLARARDLGATLGQGWYFGRPGTLPETRTVPRTTVPLLNRVVDTATSPWAILEEWADDQQSLPEAHVRRVFARVEQQAMLSRELPVVMASFPPPPGPWTDVAAQMDRLQTHAAFCGAVGVDLPLGVTRGWHTAPVNHGEEMANEWSLAVVGPHHNEVVVAFDGGARDAQGHRLLEIASSRSRDAAVGVADLLMRRLVTPIITLDGRPVPVG